jgi:alkane 1-monooxygenase
MMSTLVLSPDLAQYRDRKRYLWLLSIFVPALMNAGILLCLFRGHAGVLWLPLGFLYIVMPIVDFFLNRDQSNPPESSVPALEADPYYRYITYAVVPVLWISYIFAAWFVGRHAVPWYGLLAVIFTTGSAGGFCINVGHELGHKQTTLERWLAKIILAPTGYGHFTIEHNRGHHREVATPGDHASARMGEGLWKFGLREMPGAAMRAWRLESQRLTRAHQAVWSLHNEILQPLLLTLVFYGTMITWLGVRVLPFLLLSALWSDFQLTSANYVEHYGLLRRKLETAAMSDASLITRGTVITCSPTGLCSIYSVTRITTLTRDDVISRCATSNTFQRFPTDTSGCSAWRIFRRYGSA